MSSGWNPEAFADEMSRGTFPVSAFFLIDSAEAIETCARELERLAPYGMPGLADSDYFRELRAAYAAGREVIGRVYFQVLLRWDGCEYGAAIRYHSFDQGRYEVELVLPGVIANDARKMFSDGHRGFFCGFMPPSFYS